MFNIVKTKLLLTEPDRHVAQVEIRKDVEAGDLMKTTLSSKFNIRVVHGTGGLVFRCC